MSIRRATESRRHTQNHIGGTLPEFLAWFNVPFRSRALYRTAALFDICAFRQIS